MENPKVSIVIPVYNTEKYLQRCIDSLLAQTYKNIEFIFVDDGSKDNSFSILEKAEKQDRRIIIMQQDNGGPSKARNTGIKNCTGKYIMFCDSDDTVTVDWCELLVKAIEYHPDAWIMSGVNILSEDTELLQEQKILGNNVLGKEDYYKVFCNGLSGYSVNKIYSIQVINDNNILFDEKINHGEDVIFNLSYFKKSSEIYIIDKCTYNYFRYTTVSTITSGYHREDFDIYLLMYNSRLPFISEKDLCEFRQHYWHVFLQELEHTMKNNKEDSFWTKIKINYKISSSIEFQSLLEEYGKCEMHNLCYQFLKRKFYLGYWGIEKLHKIKSMLKDKF